MTPHIRIHCTALAAAIATLGIAIDPTEPYDRLIDTESGREQLVFLFRDRSETDETRRTEEIVTAWENRVRFEADFPTHPLVYMRAVFDARGYFIKIIHGAVDLPPVRDFKGDKFLTPHLSEASILRAHGFPLLVFTGRAFSFPAVCKGKSARQILEVSQRPEGQAPAQWQAKFLVNYSDFLSKVKSVATIATREDNKVCLFSAEMSKKEQDRWLDLL